MLSKMTQEKIEEYLVEQAMTAWPTRAEQLTALYTRDLCLLVLKSQKEENFVEAANALKIALVRAMGLLLFPLKPGVRVGHMQDLTRSALEACFEMEHGENWQAPMTKAMVERLVEMNREAQDGIQGD